MLTSLHIENIAVVKSADIDFNGGFNVLTGETGAGKSIVIDAINLLTGARFSKDIIRNGEDTATVSAVFQALSEKTAQALEALGAPPDENGEMYVMRSIGRDGRSSMKLNGVGVPAAVGREAGSLLVSIHGQNNNIMLTKPQLHRALLDEYAKLESDAVRYKDSYALLTQAKKELESITSCAADNRRLRELLTYQIADIEQAKLKPGEEEALLAQRTRIQNSEKILKQVKIIYRGLYRSEKGHSAYESIDAACTALTQLTDVLPDAAAYSEKLRAYMYEIEDIAVTVKSKLGDDTENPTQTLNRIEERLDTIYRLRKKYGETVSEIIAYRDRCKKELSDIENSGERIDELEKRVSEYTEQAEKYASVLTEKRREAAAGLSERIRRELEFLEMPKVVFGVRMDKLPLSSSGADDIEFLISTNPGEPQKPLAKIASGGELSRIMLAIKSVLMMADGVGTLIFDEIDTGVSGKTAEKIGIKIREISRSAQVLCITHLAQIAALAETHLYIEKTQRDGRTYTTVKALDDDGRVAELARIMGGIEITETLLSGAREMLIKNKIINNKEV